MGSGGYKLSWKLLNESNSVTKENFLTTRELKMYDKKASKTKWVMGERRMV